MDSFAYPPEILKRLESYEDGLESLVEETSGDPFHIGQCYEDKPATQMKCALCGGVEFHVAQGSFWTGIRCIKCRWEFCIHDG